MFVKCETEHTASPIARSPDAGSASVAEVAAAVAGNLVEASSAAADVIESLAEAVVDRESAVAAVGADMAVEAAGSSSLPAVVLHHTSSSCASVAASGKSDMQLAAVDRAVEIVLHNRPSVARFRSSSFPCHQPLRAQAQ